jgi:hypothetical protein
MKKIIILIVTVFISACAVEPVRFNGPNGNAAYSMKCSGMGRSLDECYQKAGEVCPQGYTIIDRSSSPIGVPVNGSIMVSARQGMAIECK